MTNEEMNAKQERAIQIADKLLPFLPDYEVFHFSYYAKEQLKWDSKEVQEITEHAPYIKHFLIDQLKYIIEKTQGQWYELTDKGREAKEVGGHFAYQAKLAKDRKRKETRESFDFLQKQFIYKARYWPYIISFVTIVLSVVSILIAIRALNTVK